MKHLKLFATENDLLNNQKIFTALPSVSLETETNKISMYNPSENEVVLYFITEPSMGTNVELRLYDASLFGINGIDFYYNGRKVEPIYDDSTSTYVRLIVNAEERSIHKITLKGDGVFMDGGFLYSSDAVAIDYPQNTGTNYEGVFGSCPNLTSIRLMNELPSSIEITTFPDSSANEGVLYYNSKYDYSQILNRLHSGWTAVPITE